MKLPLSQYARSFVADSILPRVIKLSKCPLAISSSSYPLRPPARNECPRSEWFFSANQAAAASMSFVLDPECRLVIHEQVTDQETRGWTDVV
jgi:hypothetical protein